LDAKTERKEAAKGEKDENDDADYSPDKTLAYN